MTRSPAEDGHEQLAGAPASFAVTVKDVKRKDLPELDEDFAIDVGFDAVEDLREDVRERLHLAEEQRLKGEFRQAALDAAVSHATLLTPPALVQARAQEMWERMLHSLSHRRISKEAYLQIDGRSEQDIVAEIVPDAEQALRREAVLTAIVEAEDIRPSEADLLEAVKPPRERPHQGVGGGRGPAAGRGGSSYPRRRSSRSSVPPLAWRSCARILPRAR